MEGEVISGRLVVAIESPVAFDSISKFLSGNICSVNLRPIRTLSLAHNKCLPSPILELDQHSA